MLLERSISNSVAVVQRPNAKKLIIAPKYTDLRLLRQISETADFNREVKIECWAERVGLTSSRDITLSLVSARGLVLVESLAAFSLSTCES